MDKHTLSLEKGFEIQASQLRGWKRKLLPEVYNALEAYATKNNDKAVDGFDVRRGNDLDCFVANYGGYEG